MSHIAHNWPHHTTAPKWLEGAARDAAHEIAHPKCIASQGYQQHNYSCDRAHRAILSHVMAALQLQRVDVTAEELKDYPWNSLP